ncbi:MAG: pyridoxamine kinase [Coprobacillus sp.]
MQRQKRIALINDLTGFGRCATAAMSPILSTMKIQTVHIPTAILSANTLFEGYYFDDYTSKMNDYIKTYKDLNLEFDAIASGFLGSSKQVEIVIDFIQSFKREETIVLIDPVMGDHGHLYATYTPTMCEKMRELVQYADIMTPNLTELMVLVDKPYPEKTPSFEELHDLCKILGNQGVKHIVVTGLSINDYEIANFVYTHNEDYQVITVKRIGKERCGTGDVIAGIVIGHFMKGHTFYESVYKATQFASKCIVYCEKHQIPHHYGLSFEEYLYELGMEEKEI